MCNLIRKVLSGIRMARHRGDLLRRLDHIDQLDPRPERIQQHRPDLDEYNDGRMEYECRQLKEVLLEVDAEANDTLVREYLKLAILFGLLTPANMCRIPLEVYVCDPSPMSIVTCLDQSIPSLTPLWIRHATDLRPPPLLVVLGRRPAAVSIVDGVNYCGLVAVVVCLLVPQALLCTCTVDSVSRRSNFRSNFARPSHDPPLQRR